MSKTGKDGDPQMSLNDRMYPTPSREDGEDEVSPNGNASFAATAAAVPTEDCEFIRNGVVVHLKEESNGCDKLSSGTLSVRQVSGTDSPWLIWRQDDNSKSHNDTQEGGTGSNMCRTVSDWDVVGCGGDGGGSCTSSKISPKKMVHPIEVELRDLKSFKLSDDGNRLTLIQRDGTIQPPLIFLDEGPDPLVEVFKRHLTVRQSKSDENLFLLSDRRVADLDQSLSQLRFFDKGHADVVWQFVSDIQRDPYSTALSAFSKITDKLIFSGQSEEQNNRHEDEMAELLRTSFYGLGEMMMDFSTELHDDGEFEIVTPRSKIISDLPSVVRSDPLCQIDWELHFDNEGRILDLDELKAKIFRGGVEHGIRSEVWKFLLGYYGWDTSADEREQIRKQKVDSYYRMKLQWRSVSVEQEGRFAVFREVKYQVEKDITRTDRTHPFFSGEDNKNVVILKEVLMTYVMFNFDLGYVQGMSDLLAPILYVVDNEVDAFWCFVGFMERVSSNFDFDQAGIKKQLAQLVDLVKTLDSEFFAYLDAKESSNMFFCFRWLLIWFKREFSFEDIMRLWEVFWTDLPCDNFHMLVCLALMDDEKCSIVENSFGFCEILKHVNDLSYRINLDAILSKAEAIWLKIQETAALDFVQNQTNRDTSDRRQQPIISSAVRRTLGLPDPPQVPP